MRHLALSLSACILVLSPAQAQSPSSGLQVPVGQTFKNFEFPYYQNGERKATFSASEATGITQNRAEATDLKIQVYDKGVVTTTITSPKAYVLVSEQKMRTKNTVQIVRADQEVSAQSCDFDLRAKRYILRTNVKVILKNFDAGLPSKPAPAAAAEPAAPAPPPAPTHPDGASMLDTPGSYSDPLPTPRSESK